MLRVTDRHRRARIGRRHGIAAGHRFETVEAATSAMTALHATEPTTPHLSLHARVAQVTVNDVEASLYDERSLVRVMAMRRTLFVVTRDVLDAVISSAGQRVAETERKRLAKEAHDHRTVLGPDWISTASAEIVEHLTGRELSTRELRDALSHLGGTFTAAPGTKWSAEVPT
ncbi:MAG: crosslink repair DNA glycosylase YcaQ family protein, partial [Ilumatobacteraceae bacterium]